MFIWLTSIVSCLFDWIAWCHVCLNSIMSWLFDWLALCHVCLLDVLYRCHPGAGRQVQTHHGWNWGSQRSPWWVMVLFLFSYFISFSPFWLTQASSQLKMGSRHNYGMTMRKLLSEDTLWCISVMFRGWDTDFCSAAQFFCIDNGRNFTSTSTSKNSLTTAGTSTSTSKNSLTTAGT